VTPFWVTIARTTSMAASRVLALSALGLATSSASTVLRPPLPTSVTPSVAGDRAMEASMRSALSRPSVLPVGRGADI